MNITRRSALRGGTATVAAIAVTGAVAARVAVDDPVVALRDERERVRATINDCPNTFEGDAVANDLVDDLCEIEACILETEAQTIAGALVQVEQLAEWHRDGLTYRGDETIEPLLRALPERIERLVGGAS